MDSNRFDALTRMLARLGSRRSVAAALPAGVLGIVGHAGETEAKKCDSSKDCGVCKKCKKGKCKAKKDGADCSGGACEDGRCKKGCDPDCKGRKCGDDGCGGTCGDCADNEACTDAGACICVPDCTGKVCGDNGCEGSCGSCTAPLSCSGGVCALKPMCSPVNAVCGNCCSLTCIVDPVYGNHCAASETGERCLTDVDCVAGNICKGFICTAAAD